MRSILAACISATGAALNKKNTKIFYSRSIIQKTTKSLTTHSLPSFPFHPLAPVLSFSTRSRPFPHHPLAPVLFFPRAYFRVLSELLLSGSIEMNLAFDAVMPAMLSRADALVVRQGINDAEFIYSVFKLLHRVGTSSASGHACVMRCRDQWKSLRLTFVAYQRKASATAMQPAVYASATATAAPAMGDRHMGFHMS